MKIGIFSKFQMSGGSEHRAVELANSIAVHGRHESMILCTSSSMPKHMSDLIKDGVNVVVNCMSSPEDIYSCDVIVVINTDSQEFCREEFWLANSVSNVTNAIDLNKMRGKAMLFLFNFVVSPSRHLAAFEKYGIRLAILTTNTKFFNEISTQDKYEPVRHIPRFVLNSPIDSSKIVRNHSVGRNDELVIASVSKSSDAKWNIQIRDVIDIIKKKHGASVKFKFMGASSSLKKTLTRFSDVCECLPENTMPVGEFLKDADIFLFFPSWDREEPWARVVAEAMTAGLPILATDKGGNKDQVVHGNNGFLCKDLAAFQKAALTLTSDRQLLYKMGRNSFIYSKEFESGAILSRLLSIIESL